MTPAASPGPTDPAVTTDQTDEVVWLDDDERRAWLALLEVTTGMVELLDRDLKELGDVTLEDYEVLHLLSESEDRSLRVGRLVERMLASRTRTSQRIDRLARRGLVRRERCPEDGRAINVILTDEGWTLLDSIAPDHLRSVRARLFDHLTRSDVVSLGRSLGKVAEASRAARPRR